MIFAVEMTVKLSLIVWLGTYGFAKLVPKADGDWLKGRPLTILILFYAAGMLAHNIWVVYGLLILVLPVLAKSRGEAAALFLIAAGSIPELPSPLQIGGLYLLSLDKWVCLSIGFTIVTFLRPRIGPKTGFGFHLPMIILLILDFYAVRDPSFTATLRGVFTVCLSEGLAYYAFINSVRRAEDLRRVLLAFTYIGFILSLIAVVEAFTHVLYYAQISSLLNISGIPLYRMMKIRGGILRAATCFPDATSFAQFLVLALMVTVTSRYSFRTTRALGIALGVITFGIFVTSTRNAWIGLLVGVMGIDLFRRRYVALSGKVTLLGMMYGTLLLLAEFVPYFNAMINGADTSGTADYRRQLLTRGLEEFHKHPYLGKQVFALIADMKDMTQGEGLVDWVNGYLFYALVDGIGGFIGLLLVFLLPMLVLLGIRRAVVARGRLMERTSALVFAVCLTRFVTTAFTGFGGRGETPFFFILGMGAVIFAWRRLPPDRLGMEQVPVDRPPPAMAKPLAEPMPLAVVV